MIGEALLWLDVETTGLDLKLEWIEAAANFLVAVESSILAGEAKLPPSLYRSLDRLLRGNPP